MLWLNHSFLGWLMFTGIISDQGVVERIDNNQGLLSVEIKTTFATNDLMIGSSVACDGICLSAVSINNHSFRVDVSVETQQCTNIRTWHKGSKINLERSLKVGQELGGHLVSGHVDTTAILEKRLPDQGSLRLGFKVPTDFRKYIATKGSITINGVSLTINQIEKNLFYVNLIPITIAKTNLGSLNIGAIVNIEIDMMARYVVKYLEERQL